MTAKRFNSYCDNENIRIRIDDDIKNKEVFHIYFAELEDAIYCKSKLNPILDLLNQLSEENEQLKKDLIDHSALISMLEDYQALKIEETLWNLTDAKSEEEFNELYEPYLEKAKRCWR